MLLFAALEHDWLVGTDVRDALVEHSVVFEVVGCSALLAEPGQLGFVFILLKIDIIAIQIKRFLICPLSSYGLPGPESIKVWLDLVLLILESGVSPQGTLLCGLVDGAHLVRDVRGTLVEQRLFVGALDDVIKKAHGQLTGVVNCITAFVEAHFVCPD